MSIAFPVPLPFSIALSVPLTSAVAGDRMLLLGRLIKKVLGNWVVGKDR